MRVQLRVDNNNNNSNSINVTINLNNNNKIMDTKVCISKCKLTSISAKYFSVEDALRKLLAEIMCQVYTFFTYSVSQKR